jgi:Nucleolar complex-associated protein/CBF/Mak21 family
MPGRKQEYPYTVQMVRSAGASLMQKSKPCASDAVPAWEQGNAARKFAVAARPTSALPIISDDGHVTRAKLPIRVPAKRKLPCNELNISSANAAVPDIRRDTHDEQGRQTSRAARSATERHVPTKKRRQKVGSMRGRGAPADVADYAHDLEKFERARSQIAAMASSVVSNPEANFARLNELRKMAQSSNRTITTLIVLTESQLYKDICPDYRIRVLSEEEASVKVSKDVANLRNYEQALLLCYTRFVKSAISLSRWSSGTAPVGSSGRVPAAKSESERKMRKLRRAACTALIEITRSLLHFNLATEIVPVVAAFTADRDPDVRTEACEAMTEVLSETHRCAGPSLAARVLIAECLSKSIVARKAAAPPEAIRPLLVIQFNFFSRFLSSRGSKKEVDAKKKFNRKHRTKLSASQQEKAAQQAAEQERMDRLDLERDMQEAHAEATPQELFNAKKRILHSVCMAAFNVIKSSSEAAILAKEAASAAETRGGNGIRGEGPSCARTRKPPAGLADALEATLLISSMIPSEILDAILAALSPLLESDKLPLSTRFRCLSASYSILAAHASAQEVDADSFTRDARAMDACLYSAIGCLYGPAMPLNADEDITSEALRTVSTAFSTRRMPAVRAAAFSHRLGILALSSAPTHACAIGLISSMQKILQPVLVESLFPSAHSPSAGGEAYDFGSSSGLLHGFDMSTNDPDSAGAECSAAWELAALRAHFHPTMKRIAQACAQGTCGDHMSSSTADAVHLVASHSAKRGGFNPAPQAMFLGAKKARSPSDAEAAISALAGIASPAALNTICQDDTYCTQTWQRMFQDVDVSVES